MESEISVKVRAIIANVLCLSIDDVQRTDRFDQLAHYDSLDKLAVLSDILAEWPHLVISDDEEFVHVYDLCNRVERSLEN